MVVKFSPKSLLYRRLILAKSYSVRIAKKELTRVRENESIEPVSLSPRDERQISIECKIGWRVRACARTRKKRQRLWSRGTGI